MRTFISAPQSVASLVAAFLEPMLGVGVYLAASQLLSEPLQQADLVLCLLAFALGFPGRSRFRDRKLNAAVDIVADWVSLLVLLLVCGYLTQSLHLFSPNVLLAWALATPGVQWTAYAVGRDLLEWAARRPASRRVAVVVGGGPVAVKVARALQSVAGDGVSFAGYFDDRCPERLDPQAVGRHRGGLATLGEFVRREGVHEVYVALPLASQPRLLKMLEDLQSTSTSIYFVPDVFGVRIIQGRLRDMNGVPVVGLCETPFTGTNGLLKRVSDVVLASAILFVFAPLMVLIAAGVKLSSPGPVVFRQRRNGMDGDEIVVYKFRTMVCQDDGSVITQARRSDPRVTRFGALLRRSSLDELPQFVNVLQGRMSVVGPRPHAVAHNEQYRQLVKAYGVRHKARPGITGWAQIHGHRGETDTLDKMQARVEHDLEYLRNWSLGLDLRIIAHTIRLVLFDSKAY